jgi:hypothetical protein
MDEASVGDNNKGWLGNTVTRRARVVIRGQIVGLVAAIC